MTTSLQNMLQRYNNFCINARKLRFFAIFSLEDAPKALQAIGYRREGRRGLLPAFHVFGDEVTTAYLRLVVSEW